MAGAVFAGPSGALIRPAQNCAGEYGRSLNLNLITGLSPEGYGEQKIAAVFPERELHAVCTHTYNPRGPFLIRDIKTRRFSLYPFRRK
jgi:hypothetical protein